MRQHKIKQTNHRPVFKETIKVEDKQKRYSRVETLHSLSYFVIEIAQDSQVNMSLRMLKILKSIIFNLSTKNIKLLWKRFFFQVSFFLHTVSFFCAPLYLRDSFGNINLNQYASKVMYDIEMVLFTFTDTCIFRLYLNVCFLIVRENV